MALDFLRRDCANINDFFQRKGKLQVLSTQQAFDFVTDIVNVTPLNENEYLTNLFSKVSEVRTVEEEI